MPVPSPRRMTFPAVLREWLEALVIAFVVAMFVRTFVFELFRIPSGSMSPTLIGDLAAELDFDNDGTDDQLVLHLAGTITGRPRLGQIQVFYGDGNGGYDGVDLFNHAGRWMRGVGRRTNFPESKLKQAQSAAATRYDRILVNKFAYWFAPPDRGDIMVFKVPRNKFTLEKPFYIKRVAGLPGEQVAIEGNGDLIVNGEPVVDPPIHGQLFYDRNGPYLMEKLRTEGAITVPDEHFLAFGDNSLSSEDSRYWGPVPYENLKGKAFFRYWPRQKISFLHGF